MFKKSLLTTAVLGTTVLVGGHITHASEVDHNQLVDVVKHNPQQLNSEPIQEGSYNIEFAKDGYTYHFESDGSNWTWNYTKSEGIESISTQETSSNSPKQTVNAPIQKEDKQYSYIGNVEKTSQKQDAEPQKTQNYTKNNSEEVKQPTQSTSGVNSHLQLIKQRESGGDYSAVNASSGASGAYQIMDSTWNSFAPSQYKGMKASQAPKSVQDSVAQKIYDEAGASQWVTA